MRQAATIEKLYLDFDGFFASVMQQAMPRLRGRPVGVIPFDTNHPESTSVIACSKEAKAAGCKNVMRVAEARAICPNLVLVPQRPDLFRRAHIHLLNEIRCETPIETIKSIDELACKLDPAGIADPLGLARRIKDRIRRNVGEYITCSIGFAANRMLAKVACKVDKPNGITIWHPADMPVPLLKLPIDVLPGVGSRMQTRLAFNGISSMSDLWNTQPKRLRQIWHSVHGESIWYALHGYDVKAMPTTRSMFGHGRVLPPESRKIPQAEDASRLLLAKAAFRMRRAGYAAGNLSLLLEMQGRHWFREITLHAVQDDQACFEGLRALWTKAKSEIPPRAWLIQVHVCLSELTQANQRQLDLLLNDDKTRRKFEKLTLTMDGINRKYGKRLLSFGVWKPPPGGYAGGKISYNRIPTAEDFW